MDNLVALLADDVWQTMPPIPLEYQGRELVARFLTAVVFRPRPPRLPRLPRLPGEPG
ncbi:MAG TPA: hypothetical protein VK162_23795 [Streptosporangiaceae bacterium]|nr:hypothetical protein [Streptosporangiaceae bacterium]